MGHTFAFWVSFAFLEVFEPQEMQVMPAIISAMTRIVFEDFIISLSIKIVYSAFMTLRRFSSPTPYSIICAILASPTIPE